MKIAAILTAVLAGGALLAQDVPATDARIQLFLETMRPTRLQISVPPNPAASDQAGQLYGLGVRFIGEVGSAPNWYYEFGGMFDTSSNLTYNNPAIANLTYIQFTDSYWSVGAAYMAKLGALTLGLHLEGRGEYLRLSGTLDPSTANSAPVGSSTTYLRPWFRGSADYTFTGVGQDHHPFIGVDASFTPIKTSELTPPQFSSMDQRNLKVMAPKVAAAVYAGMRF